MNLRREVDTFIGFNRSILAMPVIWVLWLGVLVAVNLLGGMVFILQPEGWVTVAVFLANAVAMISLYGARGFVRLLGIAHILWAPLVVWLWMRLEMAPETGWLRVWMLSVIGCNTVSLLIDTVDVFRYVRGEREPTVTI